MMQPYMPDDVRDFLLQTIDSVAQLEALLLLRADPALPWPVVGMAQRLYVEEREASAVFKHLRSHKLIAATEAGFIFAPSSEERRELIDRLADVYGRNLIGVTTLIHNKSRKIQQFADAFKLRKE
jgi:hypothetical protein